MGVLEIEYQVDTDLLIPFWWLALSVVTMVYEGLVLINLHEFQKDRVLPACVLVLLHQRAGSIMHAWLQHNFLLCIQKISRTYNMFLVSQP